MDKTHPSFASSQVSDLGYWRRRMAYWVTSERSWRQLDDIEGVRIARKGRMVAMRALKHSYAYLRQQIQL
jgi:hypothetical protein